MSCKSKARGLVVALTTSFLAGCLDHDNIGSSAKDPALKGVTTDELVFSGGDIRGKTVIPASALKEGWRYTSSGRLVINGDVPSNIHLSIDSGKLVVNGNLGENVSIAVNEPLLTHTEDRSPCYRYGYDFLSQKFEFSWKYHGCEETVVDGPKYDADREPRVTIRGRVPESSHIKALGVKIESPSEPSL